MFCIICFVFCALVLYLFSLIIMIYDNKPNQTKIEVCIKMYEFTHPTFCIQNLRKLESTFEVVLCGAEFIILLFYSPVKLCLKRIVFTHFLQIYSRAHRKPKIFFYAESFLLYVSEHFYCPISFQNTAIYTTYKITPQTDFGFLDMFQR